MKRPLIILLALGGLLIMATSKITVYPAVIARANAFRGFTQKYGAFYGMAVNLLQALICVESAGNPGAISAAGALGLTQVMPKTLNDINAMLGTDYHPADLFDPETSVRCGTAYLTWLLGYYGGDLHLAIRAYNQGPGNIDKNPSRGQDYLDRVSAYYHAIDGGYL